MDVILITTMWTASYAFLRIKCDATVGQAAFACINATLLFVVAAAFN